MSQSRNAFALSGFFESFVTAAARDYQVVEQTTAAGIERDNRAAT